MNWWGVFEIEAMLQAAERSRRRPVPIPPEEPAPKPGVRRRLAEGLVNLGVLLDAEASRNAIGPIEKAPRLNGSDV